MIIVSEDFKKKLKAYREGKLTAAEKEEVEKELDKIEQYQVFLEEEMDNCSIEETSIKNNDMNINQNKNEKKVIRRAKWKARIHNALTSIAIIIAVLIVCGILTSVYYTSDKYPNRMIIYRDIIKSTIAVSEPNLRLNGGSGNTGTFFTMYLNGKLLKRVGSDDINMGELDVRLLLNKCNWATRKWTSNKESSHQNNLFQYPASENKLSFEEDWNRLNKLPEGTVAEAYVSFNKLYGTDDILKKFEGLDIAPLWFAVDAEDENLKKQYKIPYDSIIGFPYEPMWHDADMKVTSSTEKQESAFLKVKTTSRLSPSIEAYGSGSVRNKNFLETLELLKKYEQIANKTAETNLYLQQRIDYIKSNGVNIYGVVVTGPTKEILKLKNEKWVAGVKVGDVELWNWVK